MERLRSESAKLSTETEKLRLEVLREKEGLETLTNQRTALQTSVDRVRGEKGKVEEEAREVSHKLDQLNR